jgi:hypothetical protein
MIELLALETKSTLTASRNRLSNSEICCLNWLKTELRLSRNGLWKYSEKALGRIIFVWNNLQTIFIWDNSDAYLCNLVELISWVYQFCLVSQKTETLNLFIFKSLKGYSIVPWFFSIKFFLTEIRTSDLYFFSQMLELLNFVSFSLKWSLEVGQLFPFFFSSCFVRSFFKSNT